MTLFSKVNFYLYCFFSFNWFFSFPCNSMPRNNRRNTDFQGKKNPKSNKSSLTNPERFHSTQLCSSFMHNQVCNLLWHMVFRAQTSTNILWHFGEEITVSLKRFLIGEAVNCMHFKKTHDHSCIVWNSVRILHFHLGPY